MPPMRPFLNWLDTVPLLYLILVACVLGLAPYFPQPHLVEKLVMLASGELTRSADVFDLFFHGAPVVLLVVRLARDWLLARPR